MKKKGKSREMKVMGKSSLSFEELMKKALNTPLPVSEKKKKGQKKGKK